MIKIALSTLFFLTSMAIQAIPKISNKTEACEDFFISSDILNDSLSVEISKPPGYSSASNIGFKKRNAICTL